MDHKKYLKQNGSKGGTAKNAAMTDEEKRAHAMKMVAARRAKQAQKKLDNPNPNAK